MTLVGLVTRLWVKRFWVRFPTGTMNFFLLQSLLTSSGCQIAFWSVGIGEIDLGSKRLGRESHYLPPSRHDVKTE